MAATELETRSERNSRAGAGWSRPMQPPTSEYITLPPMDLALFSPTEYPHWRRASRAKATLNMFAGIENYLRRYALLSKEQKEILMISNKRCKDDTMAEFVFSVSIVEGEGLDTLEQTKDFLYDFFSESSKKLKAKQSRLDYAGLASLDATRKALLLADSDCAGSPSRLDEYSASFDGSTKKRSTLNMYNATKLALKRCAMPQPVLDVSFIKSLHSALFDNTEDWYEAGKYRKCSAFTITTSQEKYTYLSYHKIPAELNVLVGETNKMLVSIFSKSLGAEETRVSSLLKLGGAFFLKFETIHPFHDGNGRVGRLLLAYMLSSLSPFSLNLFYVDGEHFPTFVDRSIYLKCFDRHEILPKSHRSSSRAFMRTGKTTSYRMMIRLFWLYVDCRILHITHHQGDLCGLLR